MTSDGTYYTDVRGDEYGIWVKHLVYQCVMPGCEGTPLWELRGVDEWVMACGEHATKLAALTWSPGICGVCGHTRCEWVGLLPPDSTAPKDGMERGRFYWLCFHHRGDPFTHLMECYVGR